MEKQLESVSRHLDLSVIIPVFNECENISKLTHSVVHACEPLGITFEILIVDDGSEDDTFKILSRLHHSDSRIRVIRLGRNFGQTAAMTAGFDFALGLNIITMDGDLQNDPADIPKLLNKLEEGYDLVCGWRKDRKDKLLTRRIPSLVANRLIAWITGVKLHDNGCSLKAYRSSMIKQVGLYSEMHRFIPAMSSMSGARITELVVKHHPRIYGKSKYGLSRVWKVFLDLFVIKAIVGFSSRPMLWFTLLATPFILLGLLFLGGAMSYYLYPKQYETIPMVIPSISFLLIYLSAHLISMGLLCEVILMAARLDQRNNFKINVFEI